MFCLMVLNLQEGTYKMKSLPQQLKIQMTVNQQLMIVRVKPLKIQKKLNQLKRKNLKEIQMVLPIVLQAIKPVMLRNQLN